MSIGKYMAREIVRELDNRSREFFEFIMPAVDIVEDGNELVVMLDLPGFAKKDIALKIAGNVLSISAKRDHEPKGTTVHQRHRPARIDKKVLLPISVKEDEKVVGTAMYADGVVTLRIPMSSSTNIPVI